MIYFEKRPSKKTTFRSYIYRQTLSQNIVFSVLSVFFTYTFIKLPEDLVYLNIIFTIATLIVMFIFIFPLSNTFTTFRLSSRLDISEITETTPKERSELLEMVHSCPFKKAKQTFICYIVQFFLLSFKYFILFKIDLKLCAAMFFIGCCLSYTGGIFTYAVTEKECSEVGKKIIDVGISHKGIQKKFFAIQTKRLFLFYQFIPFILTSLCIFTAIFISRTVFSHHEAEVSSLLVSNINSLPTHTESIFRLKSVIILMVMGNIFLVRQFYSNLRAHLTHIEKTLTLINPHNINRVKLFSVDLINEISYTMYLLNRTVVKFRDIMKNTRSINSQIKNSSDIISDISSETDRAIEIQGTNIEAMLSEMNSADETSVSIKTKLNEVTNVSKKTLDNIKKIFENFNQNLLKMQEITESNSFTINMNINSKQFNIRLPFSYFFIRLLFDFFYMSNSLHN